MYVLFSMVLIYLLNEGLVIFFVFYHILLELYYKIHKFY